ncbi:5-formyltetrahydrofolate cyclo-ligase [Echinicola marina]|uniref:5-formyltetrahydrofolate cyclo-ligase n=1 Tax=Echinicola marina TaxID=2859768 RepID=UPI001CF688CD|nr:5-formyltetrahydrofolate cyclo-ligase [Echinicola marina]UCS94825.1 5-formyltetrahydrofolate cyclo-ligase [Echinicola marina]
MEGKAELRRRYKEKRKSLGAQKRAEYSRKIVDQVQKYLEAQNRFQHFHLFLPIEKLFEIDTFLLLESLIKEGKQVYTSISDFDSGNLMSVKIDSATTFILDEWGIPVPNEVIKIDDEVLEVVFVPLLAYDLKGNRIGYGKGFYDKFLSGLSPKVLKIGLSYFLPEVSISALEEHDVALDLCILPSGIIEF